MSADFVAFCVRDALQAVQEQGPVSLDDTPWLQARLATDVLPDAYGGHPVRTAHMPLSVVAIFVPKGWRFLLLYGPAYGLEAAVVACNRRRASSSCAAYFDDEPSLGFLRGVEISRSGLDSVFSLLREPSSALPAANGATWFGTSIHVGDAILSGKVRFQPKLLTKCKTLGMLDEKNLASGHLGRDVARKLRGDLQWLFSMTAGTPGASSSCPSPETFRSRVRSLL